MPRKYKIKLIRNGKAVGSIGGYSSAEAAASDAKALMAKAAPGNAAQVLPEGASAPKTNRKKKPAKRKAAPKRTKSNPKQAALHLSGVKTKRPVAKNPQGKANPEYRRIVAGWTVTPSRGGGSSVYAISPTGQEFLGHFVGKSLKWNAPGPPQEVTAAAASMLRKWTGKSNPRGVPKAGSKGAARQAFMASRLKQLAALGIKGPSAMSKAAAEWRARMGA